MKIRTESDSDKCRVKDLWKICFDDTDKFTDWFFEERWKPQYGIVAEDNGTIASAMQGWPFVLNIRGKQIPSAMLAGVSTHPNFRGRGLMPMCLSAFMNSAKSRGELIVFHTPARHTTFFKCLHYSATDTAFITFNQNFCTPKLHSTSVFKAEDVSVDMLLDVYNRNLAGYSGSVIRGITEMRLKLHDYCASDAEIVCIANEGRILAYAVCMRDDENMTVEEFCASDITMRDSILSTLHSMHESRSSRIKLPPKLSHELPDGVTAQIMPTGVMGAADIRSLLKLISDFDDIVVKVNDHMVEENNGVFDFCGNTTTGEHDLELDSGRLLQYLAGYSSISELVEAQACTVRNNGIITELDKRLPKQQCYVVDEY